MIGKIFSAMIFDLLDIFYIFRQTGYIMTIMFLSPAGFLPLPQISIPHLSIWFIFKYCIFNMCVVFYIGWILWKSIHELSSQVKTLLAILRIGQFQFLTVIYTTLYKQKIDLSQGRIVPSICAELNLHYYEHKTSIVDCNMHRCLDIIFVFSKITFYCSLSNKYHKI